MQAAIDQFRVNLERVRNLDILYKALTAQSTRVLDLSDLLRIEIVMAVSALDHFIHEIVRIGMLDAYHGRRVQTQAYLRFQITLGSALEGMSSAQSDAWLEDQIRTRHAYQSFQAPDNIADAIRLVSDVQLWNEVANRLGMSSQDVRETLRLIVNRRNQIAHEADMDPSYLDTRWPIDERLVDDTVSFIQQIAETIYVAVL